MKARPDDTVMIAACGCARNCSTNAAMSASPDWGRVLAQGGGLLALALAVTALSVLTFRAYQKSV